MKYRWVISPGDDRRVRALAEKIACAPVLGRCLLNRGIEEAVDASAFLSPRLRGLSAPELLPDMPEAVERLVWARERGERVLLFGDYDVDGVTATALLQEVLSSLGWTVSCYLPCRFEEGYGLSMTAVCGCVDEYQPRVLLAIDCGSTSVESVTWLRDAGIDVIVLDHHELGGQLPPAHALVNPRRQADAGFATEALCSAGLAFKLAHALVKYGRSAGWKEASEYDLRLTLDLVALGTVADLVPLRGESRILVSAGLKQLANTRRAGLKALMAVSGTRPEPGVWEVAFQLAPRLNAAGRLDTATDAMELLLAREEAKARLLAERLNERNRERQKLERDIADKALGMVRPRFDARNDFVIVAGDPSWHVGVVGIVASRVLREFGRPTIILGGAGEELRGSGRSVEGFDLASALEACREHLLRHGGHAMAAGLSLLPDQLEPFRQRLNAVARARLELADFEPVLRLDMELPLAGLGVGLVKELSALEPVGQGNPPVRVAVRGVRLLGEPRRMGGESQHARFRVADGTGTAEAIWWNCAGQPMPSDRFDLAVTPELNTYQGRTSVQLKVLDWRHAEARSATDLGGGPSDPVSEARAPEPASWQGG
jgi:single-stranded-DNA-specific exonuclease